jgi:hypothetical protein
MALGCILRILAHPIAMPPCRTSRNIAQYRDPAGILIDQMKQIYIE